MIPKETRDPRPWHRKWNYSSPMTGTICHFVASIIWKASIAIVINSSAAICNTTTIIIIITIQDNCNVNWYVQSRRCNLNPIKFRGESSGQFWYMLSSYLLFLNGNHFSARFVCYVLSYNTMDFMPTILHQIWYKGNKMIQSSLLVKKSTM